MEVLLELSKKYGCSYPKSKKDIKSIFKNKTIKDMGNFFGDKNTIVDCGMATTGLIVMYIHTLIQSKHLDDITKLLTDPKNKDENFFTIPTDGVLDKNMLLRILPRKEIGDSSIFKIQYFKTNYLQDKIMKHNLDWFSTSWGLWCIELGCVLEQITDAFLYTERNNYTKETVLYLFFNGVDDRFEYRWVIGNKKDIETVTYTTCIRDMNTYLQGFKSLMIKPNSVKEEDILENVSKNLVNTYKAIIENSPEILDIQMQPIHTHIVDAKLNLEKILKYLMSYINILQISE